MLPQPPPPFVGLLAAQSKILIAARLHYLFYLLKWFWSPLEIRISCKTQYQITLLYTKLWVYQSSCSRIIILFTITVVNVYYFTITTNS